MNDGMAQSSGIFLFLRYSLGDKVDMSIVRQNKQLLESVLMA